MKPTTDTQQPPPLFAWLILIFLALTWGSSYILIKKGLIAFSPVQLACLRISISSVAFFPVFLLRWSKIDWSKWLWLLIVGLAGSGIPAFLFAIAQTKISSSMAGLLSSLGPIFTLLVGVIIFRLPTAWTKVLGIVIGLIGAIFLVIFGQSDPIGGDTLYGLLVVMGMIFYAISSNTVQAKLQGMNSITLSAVAFTLIGIPAVLMLFFGTGFLETMETNSSAWQALGYVAILALAGTVVASILFFKLVQMTEAIFASMVSYLIPLVALAWGVWDGELITIYHLIGMGLILFGVYFSRR